MLSALVTRDASANARCLRARLVLGGRKMELVVVRGWWRWDCGMQLLEVAATGW